MNVSVGLMLTGLAACSDFDAELANLLSLPTDSKEETTRANLITYEITDMVAGTLGEVVEANGYADAQKLVITGTFRQDDANYIIDSMPSLEVLDVSGAKFYDSYGGSSGWDENDVYYYIPESYYEETSNYVPHDLFASCSNLKEIVLPDEGIERIGSMAFFNCTSLETVNIPSSTQRIESGVFENCTSLKTIHLPQSIEYVGGDAFWYCTSLTELDLSMLPESQTSLGWGVCYNCTSLTTVKLSPYITTLEGAVFYNCPLTDFNETFQHITTLNSWGNFQGCQFTSVDLSHITSMGTSQFESCTALTSVVFPQGITKIEDYTFYACSSLTSIDLPVTVTEIGYEAFVNTGLTSITLSDNVTEVGESAFAWCSNLTSVTLPSSMTKISDGLFEGCSSLASISLPSSVTEIGNWAFAYTGFTTFEFSDNITDIGEYAFYNCNNLTDVSLPKGLTELKYGTFYDCRNLTSIDFPESLETIGTYALAATGFKEFTVPSTVKTIGRDAFYNCTSLITLTIPASVTTVEGPLVDYSWSIKYVIWNSSADVWDISGGMTPYLFIYTQNGKTPSYGPNWQNVIVDGVYEGVVNLSQNGSGLNFPVTVTAKEVTYTCYFYNWDYDNGWQTIALPFTPTRITHVEKGDLAPFNSGVEGTKPFWLRELTTDGFVDVTTMEPNKGYLISMPYNPDLYLDEYNIQGDVTFHGENVTINPDGLLTDEAVVSVGADYSMYPTYTQVPAASDVYALNTTYSVSGYEYGSVFVHSAIDVRPFEAYLKNNTSTMRSVLTMNNKRSAVRSNASQAKGAAARGTQSRRKPCIEDR
jgi:hypothetical protein